MLSSPRSDCPHCRLTPSLRRHHDRLLAVETDADELLDLLELAVTWGELDYSRATVLPPEQWPDFAARHPWQDRDRVERIFSLAVDVALCSLDRGSHLGRRAAAQLIAAS